MPRFTDITDIFLPLGDEEGLSEDDLRILRQRRASLLYMSNVDEARKRRPVKIRQWGGPDPEEEEDVNPVMPSPMTDWRVPLGQER